VRSADCVRIIYRTPVPFATAFLMSVPNGESSRKANTATAHRRLKSRAPSREFTGLVR
jgi:hypothetical protein